MNEGTETPGVDDSKSRRLWRILLAEADARHRNYDSALPGAKVTDVLDVAEECGIDRFWASETLMFWIERGDIRRSTAPNRVVPQRERWMP